METLKAVDRRQWCLEQCGYCGEEKLGQYEKAIPDSLAQPTA